MVQLKCPLCGRPVDAEHAPAMPFCSERCRLADLHRWLSERYGVPVEPDPDEVDFEADPDADGP